MLAVVTTNTVSNTSENMICLYAFFWEIFPIALPHFSPGNPPLAYARRRQAGLFQYAWMDSIFTASRAERMRTRKALVCVETGQMRLCPMVEP